MTKGSVKIRRIGSKSKLEGDESFCSDVEVCTVTACVSERDKGRGTVDGEHEGGLCWIQVS